MEPVTHLLTGACLGRAGLNRLTACATLAAILAAEAPDLDILCGIAGPVTGFSIHRGITHSLLAAPGMAAFVTGIVWLLHRFVFRLWKTPNPQPIRLLWIWFSALVADLSHVLLDWTNNWGVRPLYPFNPRWYAGSFVFIAEPILWLLLVSAIVFPALLALADREIGARRPQFRGRGWAIAALTGMVLLWCWRWTEHARAATLIQAAQIAPEPIQRIAIEPYPLLPWRWHAIVETATVWQTAEVNTLSGTVSSDPRIDSFFKPPVTPAVEAAKLTPLGRAYLDWSLWPVVRDIGPQTVPGQMPPNFPPSRPSATAWTAVQFGDLRFAYDYRDLTLAGASNQRLERVLALWGIPAYVYILDGHREAGQFLGDREQK